MLSFIKKQSNSSIINNFARAFTWKPWDKNDPRSEKEKMLAGDIYFACDPELTKLRQRCRELTEEYNLRTTIKNTEYRSQVLKELLGKECKNLYIEPPIYFDYGLNTTFGKNCYMNYDCIILDVNTVTIGDNVQIAPRVGIYTATHPTDATERNTGGELGLPIKIGNNCWLGANSVICPGVTIGDNVVVAAGSVVNKDIPSNVLVAGNPAKIRKQLKPCEEK